MNKELVSTLANDCACKRATCKVLCFLVALAGMIMYGSAARAADSIFNLKGNNAIFGLTEFKAGKQLKVRGWKMGDSLYFGQAKVGRRYGVGVVYGKESYTVGINHHGVAFIKRF